MLRKLIVLRMFFMSFGISERFFCKLRVKKKLSLVFLGFELLRFFSGVYFVLLMGGYGMCLKVVDFGLRIVLIYFWICVV